MRFLLALMIALSSFTASASEYGFAEWVYGFKQRAVQQGLHPQFLNSVFDNTNFLPRVIELDQKQPEDKKTQKFIDYRRSVVSQKRIAEGRERYRENKQLLDQIGMSFGVPPQYIVALWGIETSYGKITGGFDTVSALATLAFEGRRAEYFEKELINALKIQQGGHSGTPRLTGSWAGAMGQSQFMPSSYLKYAVDWDRDGNSNIWTSQADVFASIANYLRIEGWNRDLRWGREVIVPNSIPESEFGRDKMRPLSTWRQRGVFTSMQEKLPMPSDGSDPLAALVAPDGRGGPTYLVYGNYNVIMHWNRSTYFATSVGLLADAIASSSENQ
ncbi:MAG TPA: lytic murein transglycosylase [Alphaproteobacteria bacterium]